jgi:SAM-dependent methyltransferase
MLDYYRMLIADEARTSAYRNALREVVRPGDVVIDLGAGTGILALFACELGARHVFAIEKGDVAHAAEYLVRERGLTDRITVLHDNSRNVTLPERADVLVTETLGMLAFDEGILGSVIDARARLLRPDARLIPQRIDLLIAPIEDDDAYASVAWWNEPQDGLDLSALQPFAANTIQPRTIAIESCIAEPAIAINADLSTSFVNGRASFIATRDATLHGFAGWFSATLSASAQITNAPGSGTHWSQAFLPLREPIVLHAGDAIVIDLACNDSALWRWSGTAGAKSFDQSTAFAAPRTLRR